METLPVQAVVFDLDGTLTDTLTDIADAMNFALRGFGLPEFPVDAYRYLVGDGVVILAQRAVRDRAELAPAVQEAYQRRYETHSEVTSRPYDGVPELLHALSERGLRLCVFSNKPHADTCRVVAHYFPQVRFDCVRGQTAGIPVKPDPAGALRCAEELGVKPSECLYLGDTATDMRCAVNAGMHPIGVAWGFRDEQELRASGAEHVIHHPMELLELL